MLYQTHTRIHLDNIRSNIDCIRQAVGPQRRILIAVKANAYGHGALEVSRLAERSGVDWLGVATVPEGLELRQAGIRLPLLKFSPAFPEEMEAAVRADLTLAVCERDNVDTLEALCRRESLLAAVHLKVETGMGRIGVTGEEAPALAAHIERRCPHLRLEGLFTHLPVSDAADPAYTRRQIEGFKTVVDAIHAAIGRRVSLVHCANSGAVLAHSPGWLDLVRPGITVYGYYPDPATPRSIPLKPGLSFLSPRLLPQKGRRRDEHRLRAHLGRGARYLDRHLPCGLCRWLQPPVLQPRPGADRRRLLSACRAGMHGSEHGRPGA